MKLKLISITGMHKVGQKTYTLNDGVTYFIGENGAGKSTILEAIQLALLGYIPGYAKTTESIMKHASGPTMSIHLQFDDGTTITRAWMKTGSSVKSTLLFNGDQVTVFEPESLLGDVVLPILDFNEFKSMTANKLKEWFLGFLPDNNDAFNLIEKLEENVAERALPIDHLIKDVENWIQNHPADNIKLIKELNAKLKEDQSYTKGQISKLEGTIHSLIRYEDVPDVADVSELRVKQFELNETKMQIVAANAKKESADKLKAQLDQVRASLQGDSYDTDPRVVELKKFVEEMKTEIVAAEDAYVQWDKECREIRNELLNVPSANAICPYTRESCDVAAGLVEKYEQKRDEINKRLEAKQAEGSSHDLTKLQKIKMDIQIAEGELNTIWSNYNSLIDLENQINLASGMDIEIPDISIEEIDAQISKIQDDLIKIEANKKYDQFMDQVTKDKFTLQNDLEILKSWIKLTDANGLQTELMDGPFESLAADMTTYLSKMFGQPTTASFNLQAKANSFSFGIERDGQYIQFDYLSSGEKCLFTLALMLCILNRSNSSVKAILIDDILDHLDETNALHLFDALKSITDVQFILAGVKECNDETICIAIE